MGKCNIHMQMLCLLIYKTNSILHCKPFSSYNHILSFLILEIELAAIKERLRIAERDIQLQREEMSSLQTSYESKISYLEETKIKHVAENQVLIQRLKNKDNEK